MEELVIAFTGHRPDKLYGFNIKTKEYILLANRILIELKEIIREYRPQKIRFITGGAIGVDQLSFIVCNKIRSSLKIKVELELALPFEKQFVKWRITDVKRHRHHIELADIVTYVDKVEGYDKDKRTMIGMYSAYKMQLRNMYMIDNADIVVAVWDGIEQGGTYNAVSYSRERGKKIKYIKV